MASMADDWNDYIDFVLNARRFHNFIHRLAPPPPPPYLEELLEGFKVEF